MSLPKILLCILIAVLFILSFVLWKVKRFKKYEGIGALLLFITTILGLIFLSLDKTLFSTEHKDLFYYIELIVFILIYLAVIVLYFIKKIKTK